MPSPVSLPRRVVLAFDPARDGFSFRNHYTWTDADLDVLSKRLRAATSVPVALGAGLGGAVSGPVGGAVGVAVGAVLGRFGLGDGIVRSVARRWSSFGLCGGMALAAIERWPQRDGGTPTAALQPDPLRALLRKRQERTLRASLPRFAGWWLRALASRDPDSPFADALESELDRVEARLGAGRPVLLGLVGDSPDPFALHQVVGFGIERRGPLAATISVYDPNAPGHTRTITAAPSPRPGRTAVSTTLPTGRRASGGAHISTRPNHLSHLFVIDAEG